jgi:hypothetical protein
MDSKNSIVFSGNQFLREYLFFNHLLIASPSPLSSTSSRQTDQKLLCGEVVSGWLFRVFSRLILIFLTLFGWERNSANSTAFNELKQANIISLIFVNNCIIDTTDQLV